MAITGLRGFRYCIIEKDDETSLSYSKEIKRLIGARSVKISPKTDTGELHGDDQLLETASSLGAIDVEIDITELGLKERSELLGYKYENGVLKENKDFNPPEIAFGFMAPKSPKSGGGFRMVWLLKGKMEPLDEEAKTKEDKIEFQTPKAKFKFMPRINDGHYKFTADTDIEGAPTEKEFFTVGFLEKGKKEEGEV